MNETFETKIEKISELLKSLEDENITLSQSVKLYKDGLELVGQARDILEKAKLEIEQVGEVSE